MSTKLSDLAPVMQPTAERFVAKLKEQGVPHVVTCTLRTVDEQIALYVQGRDVPLVIVNLLRRKAGMGPIGLAENTYVVTQCDGITILSSHQSGKAMDVVPAGQSGEPIWPSPTDRRWKVIGGIGESVGLTWGGRWQDFPDMPHYQMA